MVNPIHPIRLFSQQALAWVLLRGGNYEEALEVIPVITVGGENGTPGMAEEGNVSYYWRSAVPIGGNILRHCGESKRNSERSKCR